MQFDANAVEICICIYIYIYMYKYPNSVPMPCRKGESWAKDSDRHMLNTVLMYLSFRTVSPSSEHRERLCSRPT